MNAGVDVPEHDGWRLAGIRLSGGYGWYFGAVGAYVPFATLYFRELGFSGTEIGILAAQLSVGTAVVAPMAAAISDARGLHRTILLLALTSAAAMALILTQITSFWLFFLFTALFAISMAPVSSHLDSYAVTYGARSGASYGRLRVWGSAGFTIVVLVVGRWMGDVVDRRIYIAIAIGLGLALASVFGLPKIDHQRRSSPFHGFGEAWRNRPLALLMIVALISAFGTAVANNFLVIHLEEIDGSARLVGPAFAIGAASELPVMLLAGATMRKIQPFWLIAAALLLYALRFFIYGVTESPELLLGLQTLHGMSYGLFLTATVTLAYRLAGSGLAATAQALLTAMSFGFGSIAGSLIGGALLDHYGTARLFQGASLILAISVTVLLLGNRVIPLTVPVPDSGTNAR